MRKIQLFGLLLISLTFGCNSNATENSAENKTETAVSRTETGKIAHEDAAPKAIVKGKIECKVLAGPDAEIPQVEVAVWIGEKRHAIAKVSACNVLERADYATNQVPAAAVSAAGGWWAGGGDYFYLILEKDEYILMQGWQDEGQEDDGFHYKEAMRFSAI